MSDKSASPSLSQQLANRVRRFCLDHHISQKTICNEIGVDKGQFSAFLSGTVNMSAERVLKLLKFMNKQAAVKPPKMIQLAHVQQNGTMMKMDSNGGWVAKEGGGDDPNTSGITNTWTANGDPSGDDIIDCLRQVQNLHRSAIKAIDDYIASAQKAKPNVDGSTSSPRKIDDNSRSKTPGPRPDRFTTKPKPEHLLAYLKEDRARAEAELALERQIAKERELRSEAQLQLAELKKEKRLSL